MKPKLRLVFETWTRVFKEKGPGPGGRVPGDCFEYCGYQGSNPRRSRPATNGDRTHVDQRYALLGTRHLPLPQWGKS